jgi:hypothetical protein
MKALLLRLATHEADAETCVRVIAYFDALAERRASPEALVRATSGVAKCCSGFQLGDDQMWRFSPGATPFMKDASNATVRTEFDVNGRPACSSRTSRRYVRLEFREVVAARRRTGRGLRFVRGFTIK